ncbi:hypothetical protein BH18ACI3_BH18ACI3_09900 [soil metagenome]|jgi:hypothetical protein
MKQEEFKNPAKNESLNATAVPAFYAIFISLFFIKQSLFDKLLTVQTIPSPRNGR